MQRNNLKGNLRVSDNVQTDAAVLGKTGIRMTIDYPTEQESLVRDMDAESGNISDPS